MTRKRKIVLGAVVALVIVIGITTLVSGAVRFRDRRAAFLEHGYELGGRDAPFGRGFGPRRGLPLVFLCGAPILSGLALLGAGTVGWLIGRRGRPTERQSTTEEEDQSGGTDGTG